MRQAVGEQSAGRLPEAGRERFRRTLLIAAAVFMPLVIAQLALAIFVTPVFADLYAEAGIDGLSSLWRVVFSLSHGPVLALLIVAGDAALFAVAWLVARRTRPWVLFIPVGMLAVAAGAYVPFLYVPLFQSMNMAH